MRVGPAVTEGERFTKVAAKNRQSDPLVPVIVKFTVPSLAAYEGHIPGLPATSAVVTGRRLDTTSESSRMYLGYLAQERARFETAAAAVAPGARVVHDLSVVVGGVSMVVPRSQLAALRAVPGVAGVFEDELQQPDTYRSVSFIGAPSAWAQLGGQATAGEGVVVGILDSGISPELSSFADPDPAGNAYPAPPASWTGTVCDFGAAGGPADAAFTCNNKLVGARRFMSVYETVVGLTPGEFRSARDDDGHGTHTASTAAGNSNVLGTIGGFSFGVLSGVAPRAHVAAYKVCGEQGCYTGDSAAAVQQAILDGVNVINYSISGGSSPFADVVELAFLDAYNAGVFVAASAGNSGPGANTTDHRGPWVTTVAASTTDATAEATLTVAGSPVALSLVGQSITVTGVPAASEIVVNAADTLCQSPAAPGTFAGKIVVCARGVNARVEKSANVAAGGAVGMVLYNTSNNSLDLDSHVIPTVHLQNNEGTELLAFLVANPGTTATISSAAATAQPGDVLASFSSRGGSSMILGALKPDIAAPGVSILAGNTPLVYGAPAESLAFQSGTSMASPHIAGAAALLKARYPSWTPGQIKSALMTTATPAVLAEDGVSPATPFGIGAGRVDLTKALEPGLTFSAPGSDFISLANNLSVANQPSIYLPANPGKVSLVRVAKSQLAADATWRLSVAADPGLTVKVPKNLTVRAGNTANLNVAIDASALASGATRHARISMVTTDGLHRATMPISVVRRNSATFVVKTCDDLELHVGETTNCQISVTNDTFDTQTVTVRDKVPAKLQLTTVSGPAGTVQTSPEEFRFAGTLAPKAPPTFTIAPGTSPAGYLPLSLFGVAPISGVGDETIHNFNTPAFTVGGVTYTRVGVVSNGYLVLGGGTAADINFINQNFPDAARPNNVLAPFWTDLNPAAGGAIRVGILTDGVTNWLVVDWDSVKEYSTAQTDSFEVWIRLGGVDDVSFTYGTVGNGDGGFVTVGAEDALGISGTNYYLDGVGTLPTSGTELVVTTTPGAAGETKTISFSAVGVKRGGWTNCAEVTSSAVFGTATGCTSGTVLR